MTEEKILQRQLHMINNSFYGNYKITFEQFIKNHVRIAPSNKHIEITPAQHAFINWLEDCKKKGLKPFYLKGKGRI